MVKKCVIDIGSNTIKLFIGEINEDVVNVIELKRRMAQLGKGLSCNKLLNAEAKLLTLIHIEEYTELCNIHDIKNENIIVSATAACRNSLDGQQFIKDITKKFNFQHVKILTGEEEAKYSFLGTISSIKENDETVYSVIDVGGGSFQLSFGTKHEYYYGISVQIGANKVAEEFNLKQKVSDDKINNVIGYFKNLDIEGLKQDILPVKILGIGGTIKIIQLMTKDINDYSPIKVNNMIDTATMLADKSIEERYLWFVDKYPDDKFRNDAGLTINRAEVILAGLCIVIGVVKKFNFDEIMLSKTDAKDYLIRLSRY